MARNDGAHSHALNYAVNLEPYRLHLSSPAEREKRRVYPLSLEPFGQRLKAFIGNDNIVTAVHYEVSKFVFFGDLHVT